MRIDYDVEICGHWQEGDSEGWEWGDTLCFETLGEAEAWRDAMTPDDALRWEERTRCDELHVYIYETPISDDDIAIFEDCVKLSMVKWVGDRRM